MQPMSRAIYALRVRHTPEGIRLPERDYRHDVWSLIQAAAVRNAESCPPLRLGAVHGGVRSRRHAGLDDAVCRASRSDRCYCGSYRTRRPLGALSPFTARETAEGSPSAKVSRVVPISSLDGSCSTYCLVLTCPIFSSGLSLVCDTVCESGRLWGVSWERLLRMALGVSMLRVVPRS